MAKTLLSAAQFVLARHIPDGSLRVSQGQGHNTEEISRAISQDRDRSLSSQNFGSSSLCLAAFEQTETGPCDQQFGQVVLLLHLFRSLVISAVSEAGFVRIVSFQHG